MKKQFIYMATALMLAGCSADEPYDGRPDTGLVPIRLSSGLDAQSRAHTDMDTQLSAGRSVAIWVDNEARNTQLYGNNALTTDGAGGFTGGTKMYFPPGGEDVSIYAIHTNCTLNETFPTGPITHTVATNQTAAADYYNSDLLYAVSREVAKTADAVPLTFYHMLAKVRIAIAPGSIETDLTGATVQIVGTKISADFTPDKRVDMAWSSLRARLVTPTGSAADITLSNEPSADFTSANVKYNEAMVVPQEVAHSTTFIRVTLADGTVLEWKTPKSLSFATGRRYTYHVTVTRSGLNVSSSVNGWEDDPGNMKVMEEANSYMVEPNSMPILIPISRANAAVKPYHNLGADATGLGGVTFNNYTVELVWGDTPVEENGVIRDLRPLGGYIYVKPGIAGNAVICVKVDGIIKWSWHIWVTEPVTSATDTETGLTWMDRNLGATSNTPLVNGSFNQTKWSKTLGLYYQWGRKDAFPGSDGTQHIQEYYTPAGGDTPTRANPTGSYTDLHQMVQNPLTFATNSTSYYGSLNVSGDQNDSWGGLLGAKTIYDPCPPGWKVPPICYSGTSASWGSWGGYENDGRIFDGLNGTAKLNHFYPYAGYRSEGSGGLLYGCVGIVAYFWSATMQGTNNSSGLWMSGLTNSLNEGVRSNGRSVRCVAE